MLKQPVRATLSDFIKSNMGSQFVIPVYQRNYSWNPEKETKHFMDDLQDLLKKKISSHFLGIIIYMESEVSAMFRQLQIVDGQQRMTTAFIFLLALRHASLARNDRETAGMIDDYYIYNRHASEAAKLRMKPSVSADHVFAALVYGNEDALSHADRETYVYRNYSYILNRIEEMLKKYSAPEILDTLSMMDILEFPLSGNDNVQQIFESINATGAPLTSADLIRNYVLMNHADDVQERYYRMYWKPLEEKFSQPQRLEEFFRYYLAARTFALLSRKDVYEGFKEYWNGLTNEPEMRLQEINRYAAVYQMIYEGPAENPVLESALADFRMTASRIPAPFLMEIGRLYTEGKISAETYAAVIRLTDSYLTRRALCGMDNNALGRYFPILLRSVLRTWQKTHRDLHAIAVTNLISYNRGKANAMPSDDQLRTRLREVNAYSLMIVRPVFDRIEHDGATARVDLSDLNIEHIMPQHPNAYWQKHAGTKNADEYAFCANLIGNLTLCSQYDNTRMGNEDFAYKKKILSRTQHIRMNTEILRCSSWDRDAILKRCDRLADRIIRLYPYEAEHLAKEKMEDDVLVLSSPSANARAIFHAPDRIEVLSGSVMKAYGRNEMKKMRTMYNDFAARGILHEEADGQARFDAGAFFGSLNEAAQFLMHRGGENTAAWTYEDGRRAGGTLGELNETKQEASETAPSSWKKKHRRKKKKQSSDAENRNEPAEKKETAHEKKEESSSSHKKRGKKKRTSAAEERNAAAQKKASASSGEKQKKKKKPAAGQQAERKDGKKPAKKKTSGSQKSQKKGNGKGGRRKGRGFAPQNEHSRSEKQVSTIVRFAGQS